MAEPKDVAQRFVEDVWQGRDLDAIDRYLAPDFVDHPVEAGKDDRVEYRTILEDTFALAPDSRYVIHQVLQDGAFVAVHYSFEGADTGQAGTLRPSGRTLRFSGVTLFCVDGDKIAEQWSYSDVVNALSEVGVIPETDVEAAMGRGRTAETSGAGGCAPALVALAIGLGAAAIQAHDLLKR